MNRVLIKICRFTLNICTNMKHIILISLLLIFFSGRTQEAKYQTYSADLEIIATKDGVDYQWQNSDILVNLNYKTGKINIEIKSNDFHNKGQAKPTENLNNDLRYSLIGYLPIEQVINQKTNTKQYTVELQLINDNIDFSDVLNFTMSVMRTNQQANSYRVFTFVGTLYNDKLQIPAFKEFDNQIDIRIMFNAFWNG